MDPKSKSNHPKEKTWHGFYASLVWNVPQNEKNLQEQVVWNQKSKALHWLRPNKFGSTETKQQQQLFSEILIQADFGLRKAMWSFEQSVADDELAHGRNPEFKFKFFNYKKQQQQQQQQQL